MGLDGDPVRSTFLPCVEVALSSSQVRERVRPNDSPSARTFKLLSYDWLGRYARKIGLLAH
jgi:hypothetical protein